MEKDNTIQKFVLGFIVVILAIAFIISIASQTTTVIEKTVVAGESNDLSTGCVVDFGAGGQINETNAGCNITVTNYPSNWKIEDCPLTSVTVRNATDDFVLSTDYNLFASTGIVQMLNVTGTQVGRANTTLVDYTYCGDGYVNSSWGRNILGVNVGLYAVAILVVTLGLIYALWRKYEN